VAPLSERSPNDNGGSTRGQDSRNIFCDCRPASNGLGSVFGNVIAHTMKPPETDGTFLKIA